MTQIDIFQNDAFSTREMGAAVNNIPNQWGRIGELGLFTPRPIRTPKFTVESKNGILHLVQSSARGTDAPARRRGKRNLRPFQTSRFALEDRITGEDIEGIRAFGTDSELVQVVDEVGTCQIEMRANTDITREYLRAGAINGQVLDADGTLIVDLFSEFGVTQKEVDFKLGTNGEDVGAHAREVLNHVDLNMKGDVKTGVRALCSQAYFDKLLFNDDFKEAHK